MSNPKTKVREPQTGLKMIYKQIALKPEIYDRLSNFCNKRETYNQAISRLLDIAEVFPNPQEIRIPPMKKKTTRKK